MAHPDRARRPNSKKTWDPPPNKWHSQSASSLISIVVLGAWQAHAPSATTHSACGESSRAPGTEPLHQGQFSHFFEGSHSTGQVCRRWFHLKQIPCMSNPETLQITWREVSQHDEWVKRGYKYWKPTKPLNHFHSMSLYNPKSSDTVRNIKKTVWSFFNHSVLQLIQHIIPFCFLFVFLIGTSACRVWR